MNKVEQQIKEMYQKAFYDSIDDNINSAKPDYEWIVRLYEEIKNRLIKYIKKESNVYKEIDSQFDTELFKQMIENDVFNMDSFTKLLNSTYYWIEKLQAPERDSFTKESKNRILNAENNKLVSTFIKEVNLCIDLLDEDFTNFIQSLHTN